MARATSLLHTLAKQTQRHTGAQQRFINSTPTRSWSEVRPQRHPSDMVNQHLQDPQTVAVIGAPMTCKHGLAIEEWVFRKWRH